MKLLSEMSSQKSWLICCFFNFLTASLIGLLMRFVYLFPLEINYGFLLHAHSHVAMLGWAYLMIYVLIVRFFIPIEKRRKPVYNWLFWGTQFSVVGMMITFPVQGYALFSIIFSTMHIVLSYVFCRLVWKDIAKEKTPAAMLLRTSVLFMVFSTFGVWCLGPAVSMLGKQSIFYQIAIQFFLHFQFNGWFLFAVLALFLRQFEDKINKKSFSIFFTLLIIATFLTIAFPVSWFVKCNFLSWINACGVILQLIAFVFFYKMLQPESGQLKAGLDTTAKMVYGLALCSLLMKIGVQLLVLIPNLAEVSHQVRNFVIGFIHLTSLGVITGFLLGVLLQNKLLSHQSQLLRTGIKSFIFGFIVTEIFLFLQGSFIYFRNEALFGYREGIFGASVLIVAGLSLMTASIIKEKR
ncbi:hypothetical protein ACHRV1_09260 [Flavobacterium aquidurense]|jgi:hypothetical protein|uniref:hypothetical protein n=1 Tax=Flavobacterium aquidurense TaxID=362413 RepID=UPI0009123983|nr:hypothetical protein [Flavobacterium aquidurense]OXA73408.1 hypothetical protein B0A67_03790 [Flavobacterium aquidurense]SHG25945.1 hypothetical protein SAMN05444481_103136 [Flavobacterium frigidimaris]